jgi:molecular chaperone GrpE
LADAEPPDDKGRSHDGEPGPADAGSASGPETAALTPVEAVPAEPVNPLEQRARLAEDRLAEVLAAYRTLKNENDDVRERQSRNLERRFEQRRERLLLKFIDVLDNLDRGLEAAQTSFAGQPLLEGMILVRTQLLQTLQDEGLDRIPVVGLAFDPAVSESVETAPVADADQHHIVVKELLRGYRLNGRIVRPSRVVIGVFDGPVPPESPVPEARPTAQSSAESAPSSQEGADGAGADSDASDDTPSTASSSAKPPSRGKGRG